MKKIERVLKNANVNSPLYLLIYENNKKYVEARNEKRTILDTYNITRQRYHQILEWFENHKITIDKVT